MDAKSVLLNDTLDGFIEVPATEKNVFNKYVPREVVAVKIFAELYKRFNANKKGFVMDDISKNIGILSQCHCLQSLISLALDFGLDFDKKDIIPNQKYSIREIMDMVIEEIIPRIIAKDEEGNVLGYKFDASPYDESNFSYENEISNIDTITWVIPTFSSILKYHASLEVPEICKWEDELVNIIKYGINYINRSFIDAQDENKGLTKGWNFTKNCEEPSLYFSFAVSECYLDLYNTFKDVLEYPYSVFNHNTYGVSIDTTAEETHNKQKSKFLQDRTKTQKSPKYALHNTYNELVRLYKKINDIDDLEDLRIKDTIYGQLEANCRTVAAAVWDYVGDGLADNFFYNNLKEKLSEKDILMSTTSDALFNTVYIINIMIGGGLDETWRLTREGLISKNDEESQKKAHKLQQNIDELFESCLLAVQKAFRTYERLKNKSKDYIVDQFLIGYNEKFETHADIVGNLRKLRIKSFSILPLLIHTNTVISDYLVKFPQNNMKKYLEYIIDNRYFSKRDNTTHWIWEKDGYFSGSNSYFIVALNEFYAYHEKYEMVYFDHGNDNDAFERDIRDKQLIELRSQGGEIFNKQATINENEKAIKEKDEEIDRLKDEIKNIKRPVEDAVKEIVDQQLESRFMNMLNDAFANAEKALLDDVIDKTEDPDNSYHKLYDSIMNMMFAKILSDYFVVKSKDSNIYKFDPSYKDKFEEYEDTKKLCQKDLKQVISANVSGLINYKTEDNLKVKKSPLRRTLENILEEGK